MTLCSPMSETTILPDEAFASDAEMRVNARLSPANWKNCVWTTSVLMSVSTVYEETFARTTMVQLESDEWHGHETMGRWLAGSRKPLAAFTTHVRSHSPSDSQRVRSSPRWFATRSWLSQVVAFTTARVSCLINTTLSDDPDARATLSTSRLNVSALYPDVNGTKPASSDSMTMLWTTNRETRVTSTTPASPTVSV